MSLSRRAKKLIIVHFIALVIFPITFTSIGFYLGKKHFEKDVEYYKQKTQYFILREIQANNKAEAWKDMYYDEAIK